MAIVKNKLRNATAQGRLGRIVIFNKYAIQTIKGNAITARINWNCQRLSKNDF